MNKKVLNTLEFNKITEMLTQEATSDPGRDLCRKLEPTDDFEVINKAQQETYDALGMLISRGNISFGSNTDISFSMKTLKIGSSLSAPELLKIANMLRNIARVKSYARDDAGKGEEADNSLTGYFDALAPLTNVSEEILRCIISEDEIADDASPTLKNIRRQKSVIGEKIHSKLLSMVNGSERTYLQDAVITQRDGRYCLPVKAEYRSSVRGMIHDQSSTGSTFFIEPEAVVNMNNELKELDISEKEEIEKILADLSLSCGEHTDELAENARLMTLLDFIFARGSLALKMNATRPVFNKKHVINLRKARHPLLDPKKVVPVDISLGRDFDLLVITGPNTGGKTVCLKTIGLLTLMGQAGLHIPTLDRSELSIFSKVFADIGDEQSIEQSLSTFSSHMKNIVTVMKYSDEDSLCLFDELGAGTDPTEGAALAIAILDSLHQRGIRTVATTHYSELKVYALSTENVENACCEFDVETLSPTYKLLIGIPGKSNAFAISSKLGLSKKIIEEAKKQIDTSQRSFEDLISDLEASRITIEKDKEEVAEYKKKIKELQDNLHAKNEKIDTRRENIIREANAEARAILEEAKKTADETIKVFQSAGPGASMKELEHQRAILRGEITKKNDKLSLKEKSVSPGKAIKPEEIAIGDPVRVTSMGMDGTVNSLPDAKGNLFVMCGQLKTKTNIKNLVRIDASELEKQDKDREKTRIHQRNSSVKMDLTAAKSYSLSSELNLLGKTVDEALPELDKYLDDAYMAHLKSVRIVHGKGTGTLRLAVGRFLKKVSYVKEYRMGEYGEGDAGVTIVTFKD
ncbi:MAG: endonuclease MutS2 [Lachnospiraceae bacterium]|nr:endonuclease MutS2 [Lachnospiraceae bacterium]